MLFYHLYASSVPTSLTTQPAIVDQTVHASAIPPLKNVGSTDTILWRAMSMSRGVTSYPLAVLFHQNGLYHLIDNTFDFNLVKEGTRNHIDALQDMHKILSILAGQKDQTLSQYLNLPYAWVHKGGSFDSILQQHKDQTHLVPMSKVKSQSPYVQRMQVILSTKFSEYELYIKEQAYTEQNVLEDYAKGFCKSHKEYKAFSEIEWNQDENQAAGVNRFGLEGVRYLIVQPTELTAENIKKLEELLRTCEDINILVHIQDEVLTQGSHLPESDLTFIFAGNVKEIGEHAFKDKTLGSKVDLSYVKRIGRGAFMGSVLKKGLKLADDVVLEEDVFAETTFEEDVDLSNVKRIRRGAFMRSVLKKGLKLADDVVLEVSVFGQTTFKEDVDLSNVKTIGSEVFVRSVFKKGLKLADDVVLKKYAFVQTTFKEDVNLSNVKTIGERVFFQPNFEKGLKFGTSLTIQAEAFKDAIFPDDYLNQKHLKSTDVTIDPKAFGTPKTKITIEFEDVILEFTKDGVKQVTKPVVILNEQSE
ncbi:MAG: leucine-rich repeat protein [Alphaproteobacteria bacterium]|nr:MAG: leucine-rich repeat protein [Alphaproteobacteria bacterium]